MCTLDYKFKEIYIYIHTYYFFLTVVAGDTEFQRDEGPAARDLL